MKRSYGSAYDSLSSIGAIIGYLTGKILFVGIRNKFCALCNVAERNGIEPNVHKCYKNFDRNASSTSMESDAIVEGFKCSLQMHGLIYKMVVTDGDKCTNHLLRNLCKKLKAVAQSKMRRQRGFVQMRNAAALRREERQPQYCQAMELQKDILNIPSHIFGEHKQCETRENAVKYISGYSDSLLLNLTNNPAESFNSIICKQIGGKRINFGKRDSYNARIAGAVVQYNTQQVLTQIHQSMCKTVPPIVKNLEKRRQIKVAKTRESRETQGRQKKFKREPGADCYYVYRKNQIFHLIKSCNFSKTIYKNSTVKAILYSSFIDTAATKYGCENEEVVRNELAIQLNKEIKPCGLFIDTENPCLGASPDGLIDDNGLVEIKCPLSTENLTAEKAIKTLLSLKGIFEKRNPHKMNRKHRYYYQIQGQLNITQREYFIFAIIFFWRNEMLPFLTRFYNECMLPEILDSRYNRCQ
ncbi:hypothetical protein ACFW04_011717 [Cataglyphis niger]